MQKTLFAPEVTKYRRIYRGLNKLKVLNTDDVRAYKTVALQLRLSTQDLNNLNLSLFNVDNQVVRKQNKQFNWELASLIAEENKVDEKTQDIKTKIDHLKSQIDRVNVQLEKYSTVDTKFNAKEMIEKLEGRLLHSNQRVSCLKIEGERLKEIVNDVVIERRRFQQSRDSIMTELMEKKNEIIELVDQYSIAFANGMKICHSIEACRIKSDNLLKEHLQEIPQLIRAAEANQFLRDFIITKANQIELKTDAVPNRDILKTNYRQMIEFNENLLKKIDKFAEKEMTAADLKLKVREVFSLYLFSNDITQLIDDSIKRLATLANETKVVGAQEQIRQQYGERVDVLEKLLQEEEAKTKRHKTHLEENQDILDKFFTNIATLYETLDCSDSLSEDGIEVNAFNYSWILRAIETRLRHVMYTVLCWQYENDVKDDERLVRSVEFVKAEPLPMLKLIGPCPECSQVEAGANPDVERILDEKTKHETIIHNITMKNLVAKMHNIADCPKPGSRSLLSKEI